MSSRSISIVGIVCIALFVGGGIFLLSSEYGMMDTSVVSEPERVEYISKTLQKDEGVMEMEEEPQTPLQKQSVLSVVPFISQAPNGDWSNPLFQDGCEEAALLMAMAWVQNKDSIMQDEAIREILAMADFTQEEFGDFLDLSAVDTAELMRAYYAHEHVKVSLDISIEDIQEALWRGSIVIVPADGRKLGNPYFTSPGPENHMLVIIGYDVERDIFITNDPGTRRGAGYEYTPEVLAGAIRDYPTGYHEPNPYSQTAMIEVWK